MSKEDERMLNLMYKALSRKIVEMDELKEKHRAEIAKRDRFIQKFLETSDIERDEDGRIHIVPLIVWSDIDKEIWKIYNDVLHLEEEK